MGKILLCYKYILRGPSKYWQNRIYYDTSYVLLEALILLPDDGLTNIIDK